MKKILLSLLLAGGVQNSFVMGSCNGGEAAESGSRLEGQVPVKFSDGSVANLDLQRLRELNSGLLDRMLFTEEGLFSRGELSEDNPFPIDKFKDLADFESFKKTTITGKLFGKIADMVDFFKKADFLEINTDDYLKRLLDRDPTQFFKLCSPLLKANPNFVSSMQRVYPEILHYAVRTHGVKTEDPDFAINLIKAGADVKVIGRFGETALMCAAENGYTEIAEELLIAAAGADVGAYINARDSNGQTALISAASNMHPSHFGQQLTKTVQLLIDAGADVNVRDIWDQTALMKAATWGYTEIVKLLITAGADVKARNIRGETALMLAAENGHKETAQLLIAAAGADVGAYVNARKRDGQTALLRAAERASYIRYLKTAQPSYNRHAETAQLLTETLQLLIDAGANVNARDSHGRTALIWTSIAGLTKIVQQLVDAGADVDAKDRHAITPLICAAMNGHTEVVRILINTGADVNASNDDDETALMWAAREGHTETVDLLVFAGADVNARDSHGRTALMIAVERGHTEIAQLLCDHGAV